MPISAVYRKGVIKPLVEVDLKENEKTEEKHLKTF